MEIKKGIGVSPGVVISTAIVLDAEDLLIPKRTIEDDLLPRRGRPVRRSALVQSGTELGELKETVKLSHGNEIGGIFDFHQGILKDKSLTNQIIAEIRTPRTTAEYAVSVVFRRYANQFASMSRQVFFRTGQRRLRHRTAGAEESDRAEARRPGAPHQRRGGDRPRPAAQPNGGTGSQVRQGVRDRRRRSH